MAKLLSIVVISVVFLATLVQAQNSDRYRTAISVNERAITEYEINQRANMLSLFGNQGDPRGAAIEQLIDERLYLQAGQDLGIRPSIAELDAAMEEFASRGNLTLAQLLDVFQTRGISEESYRDFILAGLIWQTVVQVRFANQSEISDLEIKNALRSVKGGNGREFRFSEIVLYYDELGAESANKLALNLSNSIGDEAEFANAAIQYSKAQSAQNSGQIDWTDGAALPPSLLAQFLVLKPGQVTGPIALPDGSVAIYLLQETRKNQTQVEIEPETTNYSLLTLPDSVGDARVRNATARVIRSEIDNCLDLREQAAPYGDDAYANYDTGAQNRPSASVLAALAELDIKESATIERENGQTDVIMVCNRTSALDDADRNNLRNALLNRKFATLGNGYLQELRAEADIVRQ